MISVYDEAVKAYYGKSWEQLPWATKARSKNDEKLMARISIEQVKKKVVDILGVNL